MAEKGGSAEEVAVFGKGGFQADRAVDQLFAFAEKAFRRPLADNDRLPLRTLFEKRLAENATPRQAALDTVKLILCSPSFLYLSEITAESAKALQPYDLATADEMFFTSTPYCIMPATKFNGHAVGNGEVGPVTKRLLGAWSELVGLDIVAQAESQIN